MNLEDRITEILTAHQRHIVHEKGQGQMCLCGWGAYGRSHPEHVAAVLVAELGPIPERIFTDDRGRTWEWCGGEPGTWAWRMTRIGEPDDRS